MGEYEPDDSRNVTRNPHRSPGEPPKTGPREGLTRGDRPDPGDEFSESSERRPRVPMQNTSHDQAEARSEPSPPPGEDDFARRSPEATTQAERASPQRNASVGQPGERAREFREDRGGGSGFGRAVQDDRMSEPPGASQRGYGGRGELKEEGER